jgi:PBSX family phage portal protein
MARTTSAATTNRRRPARKAARGLERVKIHVAGPARDPAAELDRLDSEEAKKEYAGWSTAVEHLVALRKRFQSRMPSVRRQLSKLSGDDRARRAPSRGEADYRDDMHPRRARRRVPIQKDDGKRGAPSTSGTDQDIDARSYDFVDDILDPPYPFDVIASLFENSGPLRRNVDAMAANIDAFGYTFNPVLDFSHPDVDDHIRDLVFLQSVDDKNVDISSDDEVESQIDSLEPSLADVKKKRRVWERIAMVEKHRLHAFFESLHPRQTFTRLRIQTRENLELFGNAGWEILRERRDDVYSRIEQAYHVPFASVRLIRQDKTPTSVKVKVRKNAITWEELEYKRYFRRYVRLVGSTKTYFKEFGDPRVVSRRSGRYYATVEDLWTEEGREAQPANEFLHFAIDSLISPYGIARWMGVLLPVLGNRASEEVNFLYFDNKAIPPMVLLVSGGRLSDASVERLETVINERLKGRENFHKVLVIEGIPADAPESNGDTEPSGKLRLELKPLTSEMLQDGLFQTYDTANELKIGRAFRQPPLLTGDQRDANRSTADTVKAIAEEQVYQPARDAFDSDMDRLFLSNLGIRFWRFRSQAPVTRFPNDLVENATKSMLRGAITPNECRALLSDAFSKDFPHRSEEWADTPPTLSVATARAESGGGGVGGGSGGGTGGGDSKPGGEAAGGGDDTAGTGDEGAPQNLVPETKGELIARGRTSENEGHSHAYVVVRDGAHLRIVTSPAGVDAHKHPDEVVKARAGRVKEILDPVPGGDGHTHQVAFKVAESRRAKKVMGFANAILAMRQAFKEELEDSKDDFFDPATWEKEFDDYRTKRDAEDVAGAKAQAEHTP